MDWSKSKILAKLFLTTTEWNIAWKGENESLYNAIENPKGYWLADPLLFENEKGKFLFVEAFEKKGGLGRIGVLEYNGNEFTDFKLILEQSYHLSYPYVFEYNNKCYMIPESSANRTVELYQATEFPTKWEKICHLMNGNYVDSTLYKLIGSKYCMYTYNMDNYVLVNAVLDMCDNSLKIINEVQDPDYLKRAGGNVFEKDDHKYRALQNNTFFYGQSLTIVDCETGRTYKTIYPEEIDCTSGKKFRRAHTYSRINGYEAIDLSDYKFNVFKVVEKLRSMYE